MKTFIKYFVLLAISANACSLQAMDRPYQWEIIDETAKFGGTVDKPASSEKRELEYDEAPSSCSLHERQQPSRKKRKSAPSPVAPATSTEISTAKVASLLLVALTRTNDTHDSTQSPTCTSASTSAIPSHAGPSASSSSAAAPAPAAIEAVTTAIRARYERATNRKKATIKSLICPFRDCPVKLQDEAANLRVLYKHIAMAHSDKQIEDEWHCDQCEESFDCPSTLTSHIYSDHLKERQFICPHCKKGFPTTNSFTSHMQNVHEEPRYHCVFCDKKFSVTRDWKRHLKNHALGYKPKLRNVGKGPIFACPCGTGCKNGAELEAHSCTWKNTGVFLCPCKKMFKADDWFEHPKTCPQAQWRSKD